MLKIFIIHMHTCENERLRALTRYKIFAQLHALHSGLIDAQNKISLQENE